jgi:chromosome segregation ATPase
MNKKNWDYLLGFARDAEQFCGALRELGETLASKEDQLRDLAAEKKKGEGDLGKLQIEVKALQEEKADLLKQKAEIGDLVVQRQEALNELSKAQEALEATRAKVKSL